MRLRNVAALLFCGCAVKNSVVEIAGTPVLMQQTGELIIRIPHYNEYRVRYRRTTGSAFLASSIFCEAVYCSKAPKKKKYCRRHDPAAQRSADGSCVCGTSLYSLHCLMKIEYTQCIMITVAICDDEHNEVKHLAALVETWAAERAVCVRVSAFVSAESFLFACGDDIAADILLLDIQMKAMDGVELARNIRKISESVQIIFVTGYPDYIAEGYDVAALHYLMKPVSRDKLFSVLDRAKSNTTRPHKSLFLPVNGENLRIFIDDINYIEAFGHVLEIVLANEKYSAKMPLYEMENKLTDGFICCHRGCFVNLRFIKKITRTQIILDSGKALPLSRRLYNDANRAMMKYLTGSVDK